MVPPVTPRDEAIVDAAREAFLARGFGAATAEVAEHAGVSGGSVFERFGGKLWLFQAATRPRLEGSPFLRKLDPSAGQGDVEETSFDLGLEVAGFFRSPP